MTNLNSRIQKLESIVGSEVDEDEKAENQRLFYRGLHAHLADHDLFMAGVRCDIESLDGGEVAPELQAEVESLLATRPATIRAIVEGSGDDFRARFIEHGRYLDAQGIPSDCDCSMCRPLTSEAAVTG